MKYNQTNNLILSALISTNISLPLVSYQLGFFTFFFSLTIQLGANREKNVETRVMLVGSNDSLMLLHPGGASDPAAEPITTYRSTIYYHKNSPRWSEMIKIDIPTDCRNTHLRFHFMWRTSE